MGSGGFIVRFLLGLAGGLAAASLLIALSGVRPQGAALAAGTEAGSWASPGELTWLRAAGWWETRILRHGDRGCSRSLAVEVGAAPTPRLERARAAFARACGELARHDRESARASFLEANQLLPPGEARSLPVIAGVARTSRIEPRFGRVASVLAGKDVEARCWSRRDWARLMLEESTFTGGRLGPATLGFAGIGGGRVNLAPEVCAALVALTYSGQRPADEGARYSLATAVVTLAHEAQHSQGVAHEAEAECRAIQVAHQAAMRLGATRAYAASLVRVYWLHYADELPYYRSAECRQGGRLDRGIADAVWPSESRTS